MRGHMQTHLPSTSGARSRVRPDGMTVGEILDNLGGDIEPDLGVTPWRRSHRARLRAAVEYRGLW